MTEATAHEIVIALNDIQSCLFCIACALFAIAINKIL